MKKILFIITAIIVIGCDTKENKQDLTDFMTNRVWISKPLNDQFYLEKKEGKRFIWLKYIKTSKGILMDSLPPKGTPYTNLIKDGNFSFDSQGWSFYDYYEINNDTLFLQKEENFNSSKMTKLKINILNDTLVGVFKYNRIKVKYQYGDRIWMSKKQ